MRAKLELIGLVAATALAAAAFMATLVLIPGSSRGDGVGFFSQIGAERACVDEQDLMSWMRGPPASIPSTEIFMMLRGEHAEVFLQITGGGALATAPRIIYLYHAPDSPNFRVRGVAAAAVADASGCLVKMDGERAQRIPDGFAGITMTIRLMCNALAASGARWDRCAELSGLPNGSINGRPLDLGALRRGARR